MVIFNRCSYVKLPEGTSMYIPVLPTETQPPTFANSRASFAYKWLDNHMASQTRSQPDECGNRCG